MNALPLAAEEPEPQRRILVIDDNPAIHADFLKILGHSTANDDLADMESTLFGTARRAPEPTGLRFALDFSYQGAEGLAQVERALATGAPYCVVFVDVRMPPGWDGFETLERIFAVDQAVQAVLCTAYSDYGWADLRKRFGSTDRLLVLRKPFEAIEVAQLAFALSEKWHREEQLSRTTQALTWSEARVRALLDAVPDVFLRLDREGRVLEHRPGRGGGDRIEAGSPLDQLCTQSQQTVLLALLREALDSGAPREALVAADSTSASASSRIDYHVNIAPLGELEAVVLLRDVSKLRQAERDDAHRRAREMALEMKIEELAKLSTPLIPLREGVLAVPLVGEMDERRAHRLRETLLHSIVAQRATVVILDLTGLPGLDAVVANELTRTAQATRLLGAHMVLSGLSAQAAQQMVTLGLAFKDVKIVRSLETAIAWALSQ